MTIPTFTYVVNRLRIADRCTDRVMLTKVGKAGEVSTKQGIEIGTRIENRGERDAKWAFVGQVDASAVVDSATGRSWLTDAEWTRFYSLDLTRYTF
jgi:hypothetical protein